MRLKPHTLLYSSSLTKVQLFEAAGSSQQEQESDKSHTLHFHLDGSPALFIWNKSTSLRDVDSALRAQHRLTLKYWPFFISHTALCD